MAELSFTFGEWELREVPRVGTMGVTQQQAGVTVVATQTSPMVFEVNGEVFQVSTNQANCLHGGEVGFDKRRWKIESHSNQQVTFFVCLKMATKVSGQSRSASDLYAD